MALETRSHLTGVEVKVTMGVAMVVEMWWGSQVRLSCKESTSGKGYQEVDCGAVVIDANVVGG